ncbi:MAG: hypothetical protein KAR21_24450, partial [Spirochaetales bacterium]|nr:hypothetical protein [Spirochaetales bacterium]
MNYKKSSWINRIAPSIPLTIGHEQVLDIVLKWIIRSVVILGAPAIIIGVIEAFQLNQLYTAGSYSLFYILILITALFRSKLGYKLSAGILLSGFFLIAVLNFINYGFSGAGIPLFYAIFIFSTLFFKLKGGMIAIILSVIPVGIVGWMMISHKLNLSVDLLTISTLPVAWVTASALLVFLGG